jgi:hypothetical protein
MTKRPSGVGSFTGVAGASSRGNIQQGKKEGESVQGWSIFKLATWWKWGKGDEKNDGDKPPGGDPPPDSAPSSEPERGPLPIFTVTVYLEAPQISTTSIKPKMRIEFF